jgi:hypothetical protein
MFNLIEDLAKAASAAVSVPVAVAADVLVIGGALAGQQQQFTTLALDTLSEDIGKVLGGGPSDSDNPLQKR